MIDVKCPGCGKAYRFKDESLLRPLAGAKVKCPACATMMEIPSRVEAPTPAAEIPSPQAADRIQGMNLDTIERYTVFRITRAFTLVIIGLLVLSWCVVMVGLLLPAAPSSESYGGGALTENSVFSALSNPKVIAGLACTIISLVLIAVFSLVLVLLAIERNTRPKIGS
jgi:predicted Zn finger-like uncharacterized protein